MSSKDETKGHAATIDWSSEKDNQFSDDDAKKLAEMGYAQDMTRKFSVWSVLGIGFSLTNSWWGVAGILITGISSGGPVLLIYGSILLFTVSIGVAGSLSELVSALPNAAGQSFWARELAPKRYANLASYVAGWFAWAGSIFACASVALTLGFALVGCYQLSHPDLVIKPWMVVVAYQLVNFFAFFFNCYGRGLPTIATVSLYTSLISFFITLVVVPAKAPTHQSASFVFTTFINNTGWSRGGIAFITGLINTNWGFSCLDTAVHMAEEVPRPERNIPIAIFGTIGIGFVTSWFWIMSMLFSLTDIADVAASATGVPTLELFYQAIGNKAGAIVLEAFLIATGFGCMISCHTWASRLCWTFSRDRGIPGHQWWSKVHPTLDMPLNAHMISSFLVACLGLLYLGSYAAINSIVTGCIVLPYISYAIPIICLLVRGRSNIKPGPFWLGKFGLVCNIVTLGWTLFTLVMYSFPTVMPVTANYMNYVSACYGIILLIIAVDWLVRGRKRYRDQTMDHGIDGAHSRIGL